MQSRNFLEQYILLRVSLPSEQNNTNLELLVERTHTSIAGILSLSQPFIHHHAFWSLCLLGHPQHISEMFMSAIRMAYHWGRGNGREALLMTVQLLH